MKINNIDIERFNAKQLKVDIQNSKIELTKEWLQKSLIPIEINSKISFKPIKVEVYFKGMDRDSILKNIGNLVLLLKNRSILKFDNYSNSYVCFLEDTEIVKTIRKDRYKLNLSLQGFEIGNEVIETITNGVSSKTINGQSNTKVPVILEITPTIDMIDLRITGLSEDTLVIKNLKGNKTIVIDGIEGTVTQGGINKFDDTDMWEFPFLVPGSNLITLSKNTCNIKIKYNPRFI